MAARPSANGSSGVASNAPSLQPYAQLRQQPQQPVPPNIQQYIRQVDALLAATPPSSGSSAASQTSTSVAPMLIIHPEVLAMTYGAIVTQLLRDIKDVIQVNAELDKMGYNIGVRIADEFFAKLTIQPCTTFKETMLVVAKVGMRLYLGINVDVGKWSDDGKSCSFIFKNSPLHEFVELPQSLSDIQYEQIICGAIRGALYTLQLVVECEEVRSELKGATENEIRITLKEILQESFNDEEDD